MMFDGFSDSLTKGWGTAKHTIERGCSPATAEHEPR